MGNIIRFISVSGDIVITPGGGDDGPVIPSSVKSFMDFLTMMWNSVKEFMSNDIWLGFGYVSLWEIMIGFTVIGLLIYAVFRILQ